MPAILDDELTTTAAQKDVVATLPFPPVTKAHIMHCSFHSWWPKYRTITPKARMVPLTKPFLDYLRADGIVLPNDDDDDGQEVEWSDDSGIFSASDNQADDSDGDEEDEDIAAQWRPVHKAINGTIENLGGKVVPKLNWSAPKDATWMNANSMDCRSANDVYLLLKSSDFVTHDLEHAFDDTVDEETNTELTTETIPYYLVLRKAFDIHPSLEYRCFVRSRKLIALCQRDLNHFDFLFEMQDRLRSRIQEFFDVRLRDTFEEENFVFDVYVPPPHERVWLVDVNPWAPRTDPLLFSWMELLEMDEPPADEELPEVTVRIPFRPAGEQHDANGGADSATDTTLSEQLQRHLDAARLSADSESDDSASDSTIDEELWRPEFRLVRKSDPEAYSFSTPQYSAHKLPRDVVDASQSGEGLREFARDWENILAKRRKEDEGAESSGED